MTKEDTHHFIFHDDFLRINKSFEEQLDVRCMDLHSIQLALTNLPDMKHVKVPATYISYFLKKSSTDFQNEFASYIKGNIESMLARTNNYFAQNILHLAEEHLIQGLILLKTIRALSSTTVSSKIFNEHLDREKNKKRYFGQLVKTIQEVVGKIDKDIIPDDSPNYSYLDNYVILRNCFTHQGGIIREKEVNLEIRLPYISDEQIDTAKRTKSSEPIIPQTIVRKWNLGDKIELSLHEIEGISYGLLKTVTEIFKHMYKAADRHVEKMTK